MAVDIATVDDYRDPIIEAVIAKLSPNGPSELVGKYMNGKPEDYSQSELPLCYIYRGNTDDAPITNEEDEIAHRLKAVVVYDRTQDLNEAYDIITGNSSLFKYVEKYDPVTLRLQSDCLLYQIRAGMTIAENVWMGIKSRTIINYGVGMAGGGEDSFSVQATIDFLVTQHDATPTPSSN